MSKTEQIKNIKEFCSKYIADIFDKADMSDPLANRLIFKMDKTIREFKDFDEISIFIDGFLAAVDRINGGIKDE